MFVCVDLGYVCHAICYCSPFVTLFLFLEFWPIVAVWLRLTPMRPCSDVTTWDTSLWCRLLNAYLSFCRSLRWYACHACLHHPLAFYVSLYTCLHVHAWVLLASVSSKLQHNEAMDIRSKPTFVPCGHHLLFVFLLVYLFACLLVVLPVCLLVYLLASLFLCLPCLSCLSVLCLFHTFFAPFPFIACLLVSCLCTCMYTYGARTHGARAQSPRRKQKRARMQACGYKPSGCSQ